MFRSRLICEVQLISMLRTIDAGRVKSAAADPIDCAGSGTPEMTD